MKRLTTMPIATMIPASDPGVVTRVHALLLHTRIYKAPPVGDSFETADETQEFSPYQALLWLMRDSGRFWDFQIRLDMGHARPGGRSHLRRLAACWAKTRH